MLTYINIVTDDEKFIIYNSDAVVHIFRNKTYFTELKFMHHVTVEFDDKNLKCKEESIVCLKLIVDDVINILIFQNAFYMSSISFNIVSTEPL